MAWDGSYLVFVEVKYRAHNNTGAPALAVDRKKQERISRAARWYLMAHGLGPQTPVRFDVVGICGSDIEIYKNAFYG